MVLVLLKSNFQAAYIQKTSIHIYFPILFLTMATNLQYLYDIRKSMSLQLAMMGN